MSTDDEADYQHRGLRGFLRSLPPELIAEVQRTADDWPTLSPAQRATIAALFAPEDDKPPGQP